MASHAFGLVFAVLKASGDPSVELTCVVGATSGAAARALGIPRLDEGCTIGIPERDGEEKTSVPVCGADGAPFPVLVRTVGTRNWSLGGSSSAAGVSSPISGCDGGTAGSGTGGGASGAGGCSVGCDGLLGEGGVGLEGLEWTIAPGRGRTLAFGANLFFDLSDGVRDHRPKGEDLDKVLGKYSLTTELMVAASSGR